MPTDNDKPLKITADDLARVIVPDVAASPVGPAATTAGGAKSYGTISDAAEMAPAVTAQGLRRIRRRRW